MKFRKKPVEIEAVQFTGNNIDEIRKLTKGYGNYSDNGGLVINTLEGTMKVTVGDWIIKGIQGEFYPCRPDIFEATYEAVT